MPDAIFSSASLILSIIAVLISWRAFRRASDAHVINLSIELELPPEFPDNPEDTDHVIMVVRNRSLFDVEIEAVDLKMNGVSLPLIRYEYFDYSSSPPETVKAKHALEFHIVNSQWHCAVDREFRVIVTTGSGDEFLLASEDMEALVRFVQSTVKEQKELQDSVTNKF